MAARSVFSSGTALALALDLVEEGSTDALEQLPGPRKAAWFNAPNGNTPAVQEQHAREHGEQPLTQEPPTASARRPGSRPARTRPGGGIGATPRPHAPAPTQVGAVGARSPRPEGGARRVLGDPTTQIGKRQDTTGAHGSGVDIPLNHAGAEPHRQEAATSPPVRRLRPARPMVAGPTRRVDARATQTLWWPGMRSEYSWLPPHDDVDEVTMTKPNQVGVAFSQHRRVVVQRQGRTAELNIAAGSVFVTGQDPLTWARVRESTDALEIYPDPTLLADLADGLRSGSGAIQIEPASAARDAVVLGIASVLRQAHLTGIPPSDVAASTLAHRLAMHLLARYCSVPVAGRTREPGLLSPRAVDRVAQLIDAELHEPLSLERLAAVVALSPYHFARAFKASTGMPPHRFVTHRRMERAMTLLTTTRASVIEVAYAVGFSNVSHFRRVFRGHTGFLPGAVRDTASFDPPQRPGR